MKIGSGFFIWRAKMCLEGALLTSEPGMGPNRGRRKDLGNFSGPIHSGLAAHFGAGASRYSQTEYSPLNAFLPSHVAAWIPRVMRYWFRKKCPFRDYDAPGVGNGIYSMEDRATVSLVGDWGTGTDEAEEVANCVREFAPDFSIHLGDVYFVGGPTEIKENYLGEKTSPYDPVKWPMGKKGSFALSGNHEMYARGHGYYDELLPRMGIRDAGSEWGGGQWASFFCLQNKYWRIVGLDTAYNGTKFDWGRVPVIGRSKWIRTSVGFKPRCAFPPPLLEWLTNVVYPDGDNRGLILLTHHGCYSAFSEWYQIPARQLAQIIRRPLIWFWGHEHKLAIYDKYAVPQGIEAYGRCIGHGGMPVERGKEPDIECPLLAWDNRRYQNGEPLDAGYNGHANLTFDGPSLHVEYRDLHCTLLMTEDWRVDLSSGALEGPRLQKILNDPSLHVRRV
jgi:hypothetical protein